MSDPPAAAPQPHPPDLAGLPAAELAARLREMVDALPVLISYVDAEQRFRFANSAYEARFGRPVAEIVGRTLLEVFGPEDYAARRPWVERALAGERVSYEVALSRGGRQLDTQVEHIPHRAGDGRVLGFYALVQDVTETRAAERALRDSEARLALATQASDLGVWEWRLDTDAFELSPRARAIWGLAPDAAVDAELLRRRTHPDDIPAVSAQSARAVDPAVRESRPYEYRVLLPDGGVRWVRAHGAAVFEDGPAGPRAVRYVGTMEDVTDRRATEEALRLSAARLRLAIDAGRMAVWAVDSRTGEVAVSPELNRIVGLPEDARPTLAELQAQYYPGERERLQALAGETLARGERFFEAEYRHVRASDGEVRWLLVRAEFELSQEGEPLRSIGVVLDITERREAEERLRLLAREVDHRANNLLAVVQGSIALTRGDTVEEYREALLGRVSALARAHQLLAASRWTGADLRSIVEDELAPYAEAGRLQVSGEAVGLEPALAQGVALALHELATNAVKHGALSRSGGSVSVSWRADEGGVQLLWHEVGGPPVAPPTRRGVGLQVINRALAGALGGAAELDWRPEGVVCRMSLPPMRAR